MAELTKTKVHIDGVPVAGNAGVVWRLQTGTRPFTATYSVHKSRWERLRPKLGREVTLTIEDGRSVTTSIRRLTILHEVASDSPNRVAFLVADRRWKWAYRLVARDFNVPKKTGTRFAPPGQGGSPLEIEVTVDEYQYRPYSLRNGRQRWTAREAVEDVLKLLEGSDAGWEVESWPIDEQGNGDAPQFSLQGVSLRDQGDAALARLLSYIPGADLYVDTEGTIRVFDSADLAAAEDLHKRLPKNTWDGEKARQIDRSQIRPREVIVHYQREVECVFEYSDDYSGQTSSQPSRTRAYLENVIPTTDPYTEIRQHDPETNQTRTITVRQGTWVTMAEWLEAMDRVRPDNSAPWNFDTISVHWLKGDLDGALGGRRDRSLDGVQPARIQALKQHFRQTFRIQRRIVERCRELMDVRVGLLDPVTGARAPALVWGQACVIPSHKGQFYLRPSSDDDAGLWRNVDYMPPAGSTVNDVPPAPAEVSWIDQELGIFRVDWLLNVYGVESQIVPCWTVNGSNSPSVPTGDLALQDELPIGPGVVVENAGARAGLFLANSMDMKVMLTIVPAAPNNRWQFHRVRLTGDDIADVFRSTFRIGDGDGPALHVYVPPGEVTARFAWSDEQFAALTISQLLGLDTDDPTEAGIVEEEELAGFVCINQDQELLAHAKAVAAESLAPFADSLHGRVTSRVPRDSLRLKGNVASATIAVGAYPSAKVMAIHDFPGQQQPISRFALLPESARQIILGTLPYRAGGA